MLFILSFWILEEVDTFGNGFISDYPKGIFLEFESHKFYGVNFHNDNILLQLGGFYEEGTYNKRNFQNLYAGYENAFFILNLNDFLITIGRRAPRTSKVVLWNNFALDGFNLIYKKSSFSYSFWLNKINSLITPESVSVIERTYPPGYLFDRYLTIRRLEVYSKIGNFYITDYGILPLPYERSIPFSLLNPFISSYNLQWNEGYETNTILSFGYYNKNFLFELSIDDFQYSMETIDKTPPKLALWSYYKWKSYKLELLYAMPYTFNNRRFISKWLIYNKIPSLISSDEIILRVAYFNSDNFFSIGIKAKGSIDVYQKEENYIFKLPLVEPVKYFPIVKAYRIFHYNSLILKLGFYYDENFLIDINFLFGFKY